MDALVDLKSESVAHTRNENWIPNTSIGQRAVALTCRPSKALSTAQVGGGHYMPVSACWRGGGTVRRG